MASLKYDLPLLDRDTRFSHWQVKMRAVLAHQDLDDALSGFDKRTQDWSNDEKKRDRKAMSYIHLHLSNNILQEVLKEETAARLWLKLEQICMTKDLTSKMHLKQKLFLHKLQDDESVMDHLSTFKEIVADLESIEVKYDEEDLCLILLCSLPSLYANFRDTILYSRDTLTLKKVYDALHAKEKMKKMVPTEGSNHKQKAWLFGAGNRRITQRTNQEIKAQVATVGDQSPEAGISHANTAREMDMISLSVGSYRTKTIEPESIYQKVRKKSKVKPQLLLMRSLMQNCLLLMLVVHKLVTSGFLILHAPITCARIGIGLPPMKLSKVVLF
jgi:hypothetical protein